MPSFHRNRSHRRSHDSHHVKRTFSCREARPAQLPTMVAPPSSDERWEDVVVRDARRGSDDVNADASHVAMASPRNDDHAQDAKDDVSHVAMTTRRRTYDAAATAVPPWRFEVRARIQVDQDMVLSRSPSSTGCNSLTESLQSLNASDSPGTAPAEKSHHV